jgi:chemotaxis protein MotC
LAELKAVDSSRLTERDAYLLNATLQLVLDIRKPTAESPTAFDAHNPPPMPARLDLTSSTTTLARARKQLEQLDLLTKERRP